MGKNNPRVCHITTAHRRHDVRILQKQCVSLASHGYDVTLIVNDKLPDETFKGVRIVSTGLKSHGMKARVSSLRKVFNQALDLKADVYHLHDPELLIVAVWLKLKKKKVIFDYHEDYPELFHTRTWIPRPLRFIVSNAYRLAEYMVNMQIDAIVTVTPDMLLRFKRLGDKAYLVTNYPRLHSTRRQHHDQFRLCFAGGTDPQWSHELIIRALDGIEGVEYQIASPKESEHFKSLRALPAWDKSVKFLGQLNRQEVAELYARSDVGMTLLANNTQVGRRGTLGNTKIFEFMSARLPIICSDHEVWQEIIDEYHCGIAIDSEDLSAIRQAIIYLRDHPEEGKAMGERGRQAVEEKYNWATQERNLLQMYHHVIPTDSPSVING